MDNCPSHQFWRWSNVGIDLKKLVHGVSLNKRRWKSYSLLFNSCVSRPGELSNPSCRPYVLISSHKQTSFNNVANESFVTKRKKSSKVCVLESLEDLVTFSPSMQRTTQEILPVEIWAEIRDWLLPTPADARSFGGTCYYWKNIGIQFLHRCVITSCNAVNYHEFER